MNDWTSTSFSTNQVFAADSDGHDIQYFHQMITWPFYPKDCSVTSDIKAQTARSCRLHYFMNI